MQIKNNNRSVLLAIFFGVVCVVFVLLYSFSVKAQAEESRNAALSRYGGEQIEVCVAKRDISAGEKIDSSSIETKLWLADLLPDDAVRNLNDIIGKQTTSSIVKGDVVSSKRFQENAISLEVPAGLSAVSVPAKDVSAVGGAIGAGMYIDVYATGNISTTLIASNVLVLATSASFSEHSNSSSVAWITLAVEPSRVQELVSASQTTTLYFVLPSADNNDRDNSSHTQNNSSGINSSSGASTFKEENND